MTGAFRRYATIDAKRIGVDVNGGEVILKGKARWWIERQTAEQAAWVDDQITVDG